MKSITFAIVSGLTLAATPLLTAEEVCAKSGKVAAKSECAACPLTAAMDELPKISFVIAGEASACAKSAETAKAAGKEVKYVVAGKEICCDKMAKDAHVEAVEKFVGSFASTHACDASGKTFVGTKGYACSQHAGSVASVAKKAMEGVKVTHVVAGKEYCCPEEAGKVAKESGEAVTYVIAEEKTQCAKTNRMNLAVAKYKAAVMAIAEAESKEDATAKS